MNAKRKCILVVTAVLIVAAILFPPTEFQAGQQVYRTFGSLFYGPVGSINVALVFAEWVAIGLVSGIAWALFPENVSSPDM